MRQERKDFHPLPPTKSNSAIHKGNTVVILLLNLTHHLIINSPYGHPGITHFMLYTAVNKRLGIYGACRYRYTGKNSEGNRFIRNHDL